MLPLSDYLAAKQMALSNEEVREALLLRLITSVLVIQCAYDRELKKLLHWKSNRIQIREFIQKSVSTGTMNLNRAITLQLAN